MDILKEFWYTAYSPNKDLTDEMVTKAEEILGVKLPAAYLDMLKIQNGGETQGLVFPTKVKTSWADNHVSFDEMFGIDFLDTESEEEAIDTSDFNILDTVEIVKEWNLPEKQIVINSDGHCNISLDYRLDENAPVVSWIDVDNEEDIQLASSFEEFLKGLVPFEKFNG